MEDRYVSVLFAREYPTVLVLTNSHSGLLEFWSMFHHGSSAWLLDERDGVLLLADMQFSLVSQCQFRIRLHR